MDIAFLNETKLTEQKEKIKDIFKNHFSCNVCEGETDCSDCSVIKLCKQIDEV